MCSKYCIMFKNKDDKAWKAFNTKYFISALFLFLKVVRKYEIVDFQVRK